MPDPRWPDPPAAARWLNPEETARYVSCRVDHLPRLVLRGLLPQPSLHLGPRSPRYDRKGRAGGVCEGGG